MGRRRRLHIQVQGAVQGVGFRPFVFRLATQLGLTGWILNDTQGVCIEVEGEPSRLHVFVQRLKAEKPPIARILSLQVTQLPPQGYTRFEIRDSEGGGTRTVLVLPDVATCSQCLEEVLNPHDRRYQYPFTNCTNCGPRFSIIESLPYDRPNTTMRRFTMCSRCQAEYDDPRDRRFHAQPNACPQCGPALACYARPEDVSTVFAGTTDDIEAEAFASQYGDYVLIGVGDMALRQAASALQAGRIVAVKGLGGFHLMVNAQDDAAIARLRERKPRRDKPFALMVRDLAQARELCVISPEAEAVLTSPQAPIVLLPRLVLLPRRNNTAVADNVAPNNPYLGIMLPYTPLHHLLLQAVGGPVVATSGNLTDEPICTDEWEAMQRLATVADVFLVHNRPIARHVDDSVVAIMVNRPRLLRRARGYAPLPVVLAGEVPTILAVGGHLKNTVALSVGRHVFISQHIGDLDTAEAQAAFERVIADFLRLYDARPVAIACDMHPDYASTRWVERVSRCLDATVLSTPGVPLGPLLVSGDAGSVPMSETFPPSLLETVQYLVPVQHHHAHLAACLAEHGLSERALGVTWDGTGYGLDGTIWGGEFLLGNAQAVERVATLRPFLLPGGDAAIKAPRRVAVALLWELYGDAVLAWEHLAPVRALSPSERRLLGQVLARRVNAPLTTSVGRLFDAVAALLDVHQEVSFEGQAAMALEYLVTAPVDEGYPLILQEPTADVFPDQDNAPRLGWWDWRGLVEGILEDLRRGVDRAIIAARFHRTLVAWILHIARAVGLPRVVFTGGVFQNRVLTAWAVEALTREGFQVLLHEQVPPNDGGISLGQVAVAAARLRAMNEGVE